MSRELDADALPTRSADQGTLLTIRGVRLAYHILHVGFAALLILAGADKFFHLLVNRDQYLTPVVAEYLPVSSHTFVLIVGVIEIIAGLLVAVRPWIGAYVLAFWLWALRDSGLALEALALARMVLSSTPTMRDLGRLRCKLGNVAVNDLRLSLTRGGSHEWSSIAVIDSDLLVRRHDGVAVTRAAATGAS